MIFINAKKADSDPRFLQIVAKPDRAARRKSKSKAEPKLTRVAFKVSRLMEFCTPPRASESDWAFI